jgi:hypothetical protein
MPKPQLQIKTRISNSPLSGGCKACDSQFLAPSYLRDRPDEERAHIQTQFDSHACSRECASQTGVQMRTPATN